MTERQFVRDMERFTKTIETSIVVSLATKAAVQMLRRSRTDRTADAADGALKDLLKASEQNRRSFERHERDVMRSKRRLVDCTPKTRRVFEKMILQWERGRRIETSTRRSVCRFLAFVRGNDAHRRPAVSPLLN